MVETRNCAQEIFSGIGHGSQMAHCARVESDMLKGVHRMSLATHQYEAIELAFESLEETFGWKIPAKTFLAACISPFVFGVVAAKTGAERLPYVKKGVLLLQSQIGNVCQVAMLVSAAVNIVQGKVIRGALAISCLFLGGLSRYGFLPQNIADRFDYAFSIIGMTDAILNGSWTVRAINIFNVTDIVLEIALRIKGKKPEPIPEVEATLAEFEGKSIEDFEINPVHFSIPLAALPKTLPDVEIGILNEWVKEISWHKELWEEQENGQPKSITAAERLDQLIRGDVQWKENPLRGTEPLDFITYVEKGLNHFVEVLSRRSDNDPVKIKSALCVEKMNTMNPEQRVEHIINLGLAGYYCPRGFSNEVSSVYLSMFEDSDGISIPDRIYRALHSEREYEFNSLIARAYDWKIFGCRVIHLLLQLFIGDQEDPHSNDVFQATFGNEYNLLTVEEAESNLPVEHRSGPLSNMTLDLPWRLIAKRDFEKCYTVEKITEVVNNTLFSFTEQESAALTNWFKESFPSDQNVGEKDLMKEIFEENEEGNYFIKSEWLLPMLVKMSVLRPKTSV